MRWWRRKQRDEDLAREIECDLELEEEEQRERGLSPEEALFAAARAFGNPTVIREQTRAVWTWNWLERLVRDLKYGARTLWRSPSFSIVSVLVMASVSVQPHRCSRLCVLCFCGRCLFAIPATW